MHLIIYENIMYHGSDKYIESKFAKNLWNTPPRDTAKWKESFQDMNVLVGYSQLKYNWDQTEYTVIVFTKTAKDLELTYVFNGIEQKSNYFTFDSAFKDILKIKMKAKIGEILELEDIDFIWNSEPLDIPKYDTKGKRGAIIEMYGWKDKDI